MTHQRRYPSSFPKTKSLCWSIQTGSSCSS